MIVLLAGPTVPNDEMMLLQNEKLIEAQGVTGPMKVAYLDQQKALFKLIKEGGAMSTEEIKDALFKFYEDRNGGMNLRDNPQIKQGVAQMSSPWMRFFLAYDPTDNLKALQCPILALNGDKDLQVVAEQNIPAAEKALAAGGNKDYEVKIFPDLNHLFQKAERGTVDEYGTIEETINPAVLEYVANWLLERI